VASKQPDKAASKFPFLSKDKPPPLTNTNQKKGYKSSYDDDSDDDFTGIKPVNKNKKPAASPHHGYDDDDIGYGSKHYTKTKGGYDDDDTDDDDWDPKKPKKKNHDDDDWDHNDKRKNDKGHPANKKKDDEEEFIYLKIAVVKKDGKYDMFPLDNNNEPIPPIVRKDGSKLYTKKSPSNSPDYHSRYVIKANKATMSPEFVSVTDRQKHAADVKYVYTKGRGSTKFSRPLTLLFSTVDGKILASTMFLVQSTKFSRPLTLLFPKVDG
jgi:hypothetical protein